MKYKIFVKQSVTKKLLKLPNPISQKLSERINSLSENPRPFDCKKLKGLNNKYRIRISNYRFIYSIYDNKLVVEIIKIGHRKDIYK